MIKLADMGYSNIVVRGQKRLIKSADMGHSDRAYIGLIGLVIWTLVRFIIVNRFVDGELSLFYNADTSIGVVIDVIDSALLVLLY